MIRHQIKSYWYYIFWGIATVSVVAGQLYVGTGYREMANEVKESRETIQRIIPWTNP